jgi:hypothetical protein
VKRFCRRHFRNAIGPVFFALLCALTGTKARAQGTAVIAPLPPRAPTNLVGQVTELIRGHAEPTVVIAFIDHWTVPYLTSVEDLLTLRQVGASLRIVAAFEKRGAELRLRAHRQLQRDSTSTNSPQVVFFPVFNPPPGAGWNLPFSPNVGEINPYFFSDRLSDVSAMWAFNYNWAPYFWLQPWRWTR